MLKVLKIQMKLLLRIIRLRHLLVPLHKLLVVICILRNSRVRPILSTIFYQVVVLLLELFILIQKLLFFLFFVIIPLICVFFI